MTLLACCPHCRHEFPIAPRFRGGEVACVACGDQFLFTDGPELPDTGEEYVIEAPAGEPAEVNVELVPVIARRQHLRQATWVLLLFILPAFLAGGGVVYLWHRSKVQAFDPGWPVVDLPVNYDPTKTVFLHVSGVDNEYIREAVWDRALELAGKGSTHTCKCQNAGNRMTILVTPVSDPQTAAKAIDFGVVESIDGRVITLRANPVPAPPPGADVVDRALFVLQHKNSMLRADAIRELAKSPADHRRKAVADTLARALGDMDLAFGGGDEILAALSVWGIEDCVPAIENYMWDNRLNPFLHSGRALKALAKIKGKRALEVVMRAFDEGRGFDRKFEFGDPELGEPYDIKMAIIAFGPEAEDAVLERFRPKNVALYEMMCNLLKEIGTEKSIPFLDEAAKNDPVFAPHARAAIQSIQSRKK
jgi:hypothetical protein